MASINLHERCPLCNSKWGDPTYDEVCAGNRVCAEGCGMMKTMWGNVFRDVGEYEILWFHTPNECQVWLGSAVIYTGEDLPFDISEDMIKMLLVFS